MYSAAELDSQAYRTLIKTRGLVSARVVVKQTDMLVSGRSDLSRRALPLVVRYRRDLEDYIRLRPEFQHSLEPIGADESAPEIARTMIEAAARANVGPMAAVAGAMADFVGRGLLAHSPDVLVENGGDVMVRLTTRREMLILAENSPLGSVKIALGPTPEPMGVCTSSGTLGHSLSFGRADAVTILDRSAANADAAATAVGNVVKDEQDVEAGLERAREIGVDGVLILIANRIGAWGRIDIIG
jgi:uncharacterized protein